jgi:hypothetical protein
MTRRGISSLVATPEPDEPQIELEYLSAGVGITAVSYKPLEASEWPLIRNRSRVLNVHDPVRNSTVMGIVDPAGPAWDRLAAEEKRLRDEIAHAPNRKTRRALKRELRSALQKAVTEANEARRGDPPVTH